MIKTLKKTGANPITFIIEEIKLATERIKEIGFDLELEKLKVISLSKEYSSKFKELNFKHQFDDRYFYSGTLFISKNKVILTKHDETKPYIDLDPGDLIIPIYLKSESVLSGIDLMSLSEILDETTEFFSNPDGLTLEHYFYGFTPFKFEINFVESIFKKIENNYLLDYFLKSNEEIESSTVLDWNSKRFTSLMTSNKVSYNEYFKDLDCPKIISKTITNYLSSEIDCNNLLLEIVEKISSNKLYFNKEFYSNDHYNFFHPYLDSYFDLPSSLHERTILLFKKLSFDKKVSFISLISADFNKFKNPQVLSFLISDFFCILKDEKYFKSKEKSLLESDDFIDSLITSISILLLSKEGDVLSEDYTRNVATEVIPFLFLSDSKKSQTLLFKKMESLIYSGYNCFNLSNIVLHGLLIRNDIINGFADKLVKFLQMNINSLQIRDCYELEGQYDEYRNPAVFDLFFKSNKVSSYEDLLQPIREDEKLKNFILPEFDD